MHLYKFDALNFFLAKFINFMLRFHIIKMKKQIIINADISVSTKREILKKTSVRSTTK